MEMVEELQNHPKIDTNQTKLHEIVEEGEEDRISGLPDNLLVEILSRFPTTKEAIRTGTLSKRWKHVWTSVPSLYLYYDRKMSDFVSCVDKTLTRCRQLKLKEFVMYTSYDPQFESQINNWFHHAINCNVEQLNFHLNNLEFKFVLDQSFFNNTSFTHLRLRGCLFTPISAITWKNLRKLFISHSKLDEFFIENLLSGSPVLQTLVLFSCLGFNRLDITSESVKELEFIGYNNLKHFDEDPTDVIVINAPNIQSLTIHGELLVEKLLLLNVSCLVEANLSFKKPAWDLAEEEEILKGLLLNLLHVNEVKLGFSSSYILSRLEAKGFVVPSNVKLPDVSSYSDADDWLEAGDLAL